MVLGPTNVTELSNSIAQSTKNVSLSNDKLGPFVAYLIGSRPILVSYLTAEGVPGIERPALDMMILTTDSLYSIQAYYSGRVSWSKSLMRDCSTVGLDMIGNIVVGSVVMKTGVTFRIADTSSREGELNGFLLQIASVSEQHST
jgi:hypothetical protein